MLCLRPHFRAVNALPALLLLSGCVSDCTALAQQSPTSKAKEAAITAAYRSPNVKTGELTALTEVSLTLKPAAGAPIAYALTGDTRCMKGKREVKVAAFQVGEKVVVHLRKSRKNDTYAVTDLCDKETWEWLATVKHAPTPVTITALTDSALTGTVSADIMPLDYTISEKTHWNKAGKEAQRTDFKVGDKVYVAPRSLPSGRIMAIGVADSLSGAAQAKERTARTVHGVVLAAVSSDHKVTLKTVAGDTRTLLTTDSTELHQSSKILPLTALKAGLHVSARVTHEDSGEDIVDRFTIEAASLSKKSTSGASMPTSAPSAANRKR